MACLSSPPPKWSSAPPVGHGRGMFHTMHHYGLHQGPPRPHFVKRTPLRPIQPQPHYYVFDTEQHQHPRLIESFLQVKSPMSRCIDTIIGAAEAVNRRDALVEQQSTVSDMDVSNEQQPKQLSGSKRKKSPTTIRPSTTKKAPRKVSIGGDVDPETIMTVEDVERHLNDKDFYHAVSLVMCIEQERTNRDDEKGEDSPVKEPSPIIGEGFFWKEYPLLESYLFEQMHDYYDNSNNCRHSKSQQVFNNALCDRIKEKAASLGYTFDPEFFTEKRLRDRIRCFYKTHLQNAKKRLNTIQKHVLHPEQRRFLQDLILKAKETPIVRRQVSDDEEDDDQEYDFYARKFRRRRLSSSRTLAY